MAAFWPLCRTPIWNSNLTWNSDRPRFTSCFEAVVIPMVPTVALLLTLILDFPIRNKKFRSVHLRWTLLTSYRLVLHITLPAFESIWLAFPSDRQKSVGLTVIRILCHLLPLLVFLSFRHFGKRMSLCLNVYWLVAVVTSLWKVYSAYIGSSVTHSLKWLIQTAICSLGVACSTYRDPPSNSAYSHECCFLKGFPFWSRFSYSWMWRIFAISRKTKLETKHFYPLCAELSSEVLLERHGKKFERGLSSLCWLLFRVVWTKILTAFVIEMLASTCSIMQPLTIGWIIDAWKSDARTWHHFMYCLAFATAVTGDFILGSHRLYFTCVGGLQVISVLASKVYHKCFKLSSSSRKKFTAGDITNIVSIDLQEVFDFFYYFTDVFPVFLRLPLCMFILWTTLGLSAVSAVVVVGVMGLCTWLVNKKVRALQESQMNLKDKRTAQMKDILTGIKHIKFHAWEPAFISKVEDIRKNELRRLRTFHFWNVGYTAIWSMAPWIMASAAFVTFVVANPSSTLTAKHAFVSMSVFLILREPISSLDYLVGRFIRANVSLRRIQTFLQAEELSTYVTSCKSNSQEKVKICLEEATLAWSIGSKSTLTGLNLKVTEGSLIAVVGKVGSGKSSLLSCLIGNMYKTSGEVVVNGTIGYVPQEAWLQNTTVKDNIVFGCHFNEEQYSEILYCCALLPDLKLLPAGDITEIGERGVNLSGGQKQRISLARAVYQNKDIYLLDDPLSAVDVHVAQHLFQKVIGPEGLLRQTTRILVTHHLACLPGVDAIIVMREGKIFDYGSYNQLVARGTLDEHITQNKTSPEHNKVAVAGEEHLTLPPSGGGAKLVEDEEYNTGVVTWAHYFSYIQNSGLKIGFIVLGATSIGALCEIAANFWLSYWTSGAVGIHPVQSVSIYVGLLSGGLLVLMFGVIFMYIGSAVASRKLHGTLLEAVMRCPVSFFETNPLGRILNRFSRDMYSVDEGIPNSLFEVTKGVTYYTVVYLLLAAHSLVFLLMTSIVVIIYHRIYVSHDFIPAETNKYMNCNLQKIFVWTSRQLQRLLSVNKSPIFSFVAESFNGIETLRALGAEHYFCGIFSKRLDVCVNCWYTLYTANRTLECTIAIIAGTTLFVIGLTLFYLRDSVAAGTAAFVLNYTVEALFGVFWLVRVCADLEVNMVGMERIAEYIQLPGEGLWKKSSQADFNPVKMGTIEFRNFSTAYRKELNPVLKNLNIVIKSGQKVGIVGRTGAGKSTIAASLFRIIEPTSGTIFIDGHDVRTLGLHEIRRNLSIIPQDPFLFPGTLRQNLDPTGAHGDEILWTVLTKAHLREHFARTGLDGQINEGGGNLSAGQKQLVCLARALLRNSKILVLDEATASVDVETDRLIQKTIRQSFFDCTMLTIAHRLHTILDYDRVIVLSNGEVLEDASPQDLLAHKSSTFSQMVKEAGIVINSVRNEIS